MGKNAIRRQRLAVERSLVQDAQEGTTDREVLRGVGEIADVVEAAVRCRLAAI